MAYDLPFLGKGERDAQNLHPRYDESPWDAPVPVARQPLIPSTPPPLVTGSSAYMAWLAADQAAKNIQLPPSATPPRESTMVERIEEFERAGSPYGEERRTFTSQEPEDSFLGTVEREAPLTRTEVAERFSAGLSPEMERGLIAGGQIEAPAPTIKTNTYPWIAEENRWEAPVGRGGLDEITDPGFEEFVRDRPWSAAQLLEDDPSDQWVDYPVIGRDGTTTKKVMPKPLAQTLAKRGGFGDQPSTRADFLDGLEWVVRPLEVFAETVTETFAQLPALIRGDFGDIEAPTLFTDGFVAAYEEFKDRPMWQQIVLGIVTDPVVMFKAFTISAKIARAGGGALSRDFQALHHPEYLPLIDLFITRGRAAQAGYVSDDALEEIAGTLAAKMDEVIAATPAAKRLSPVPWVTQEGSAARWEEFLGRGEEMGRFPVTSLSDKRAQWKLLRDEYKLALDSGVNEFAVPMRGMQSVVDEVVTRESTGLLGKVTDRVIGAIAGPSITRSTAVGKITTAHGRQVKSAHELVKIAMASVYDRHIGQFDEIRPGGVFGDVKDRVIPVNSKGEWLDSRTGKVVAQWQQVFEKPDQYSQFISDKARKLIDDVNRMTNEEVPRLLDDEGMPLNIRNRPENEYYVPHNVQEIRGVDVSDIKLAANLRRHYDEVTDGMAQGIKYGTNPRQDIELYMRWAYRKIVKKQLDDALDEHGLTRSQLVPKDIHDAAVDSVLQWKSLLKQSRMLAGQIRLAIGVDRTLGRGVAQQEGIETKLNAELARLRSLLDDLPDLVGVGDAPGRQNLDAARKNLNEAIRLQGKTATAVRNARSQVAVTTGKASARADELRRLDARYEALVSARDAMVKSSRAYAGESPSVLASEIRQQDLTQRQFRTLGTEQTRAGRAADAAAGRVDIINARKRTLSELADQADEELQVAKELTAEASDDLRRATATALKEAGQRGATRTRSVQLNREIERLQNRLNRLLDPEKGKLGRVRDKQGAQQAVLAFLRGQQETLSENIEKAKILKNEKRRERSQYLNDVKDTHVIDGALWGPNQPTSIRVEQWRNRYFTPEDAKLLAKVINVGEREGNWFTRGVVSLVNVKRSLVSTLDAAEPFIQGLPVMASNPKAWGVQTAVHYEALLDPTVQSRRIYKNLADFQWLARNGVPIGDLEFFAALDTGEGVSFAKLFEVLQSKTGTGDAAQRYLRTLGKQTFGRFGAMYNAALGEARVQLLQSTRVGWKGTDAELAQYIRNLTGGLDARALGIGPGRMSAEGFWVAFSPRLLRATMALVGDAVRGGVPLEMVPRALEPVSPRLSRGIQKTVLRGKEAPTATYDVDIDLAGGVRQDVQREIVGGYASTAQGRRALRTLATLATGVTTTYIVTGIALGKDWDEIKEGLNPLNGKRFLSHQINGDWIGVGGQIRSIAQLVSALAVGTYRLATTGEPPTKSEIFSRRDNPLLQFLSGRGAIGTQAVLQVGELAAAKTGGEFDLDPFERIDSWTDFGKVQGKSALPFMLQGVLDGEKLPTVAASALGMRTSEWNEYDGMRDNKGVRAEQLQHFVRENNISLGETITVEWKGETLEFNLPEEIVEFGDLQPAEQQIFKMRYPSTFAKEEELTRALAKERNAPDWAIKRVKAWDDEDNFVAEQEESDRQMLAIPPELSVRDWKLNYEKTMLQWISLRKNTYNYDKDEINSPLDVYYAKMEEIQTVTDAVTGVGTLMPMNDDRWQELEVWLRNQDESFQTYVDKNTGLKSPTRETALFKEAKKVLGTDYWGEVRNILDSPELYSQGDIPIWSKEGTTATLNIPADLARVYNAHMAYPEGDFRTERITVLSSDSEEIAEEKKKRKEIVNYVDRQLQLFKKQVVWTNEDVRNALWKYYNSSQESVFIQDYLERLKD